MADSEDGYLNKRCTDADDAAVGDMSPSVAVALADDVHSADTSDDDSDNDSDFVGDLENDDDDEDDDQDEDNDAGDDDDVDDDDHDYSAVGLQH